LGSDICSANATLYQASTSIGRYFSFAWYGIHARGVGVSAFLFLVVTVIHNILLAI